MPRGRAGGRGREQWGQLEYRVQRGAREPEGSNAWSDEDSHILRKGDWLKVAIGP